MWNSEITLITHSDFTFLRIFSCESISRTRKAWSVSECVSTSVSHSFQFHHYDLILAKILPVLTEFRTKILRNQSFATRGHAGLNFMNLNISSVGRLYILFPFDNPLLSPRRFGRRIIELDWKFFCFSIFWGLWRSTYI